MRYHNEIMQAGAFLDDLSAWAAPRALPTQRTTLPPPQQREGFRPLPGCEALYYAIETARQSDRLLIVQILGVAGGEGASAMAENYARLCAGVPGRRVLLAATGAAGSTGLLDLFRDGVPLGAGWARAGPAEAGDRLFYARLGGAAAPGLALPGLAAFAETLRDSFDVIVVETRPATTDPLAGALSRVADGSILVARAGVTARSGLASAVSAIDRAGGQVLGIVLNHQRAWLPPLLARLFQ